MATHANIDKEIQAAIDGRTALKRIPLLDGSEIFAHLSTPEIQALAAHNPALHLEYACSRIDVYWLKDDIVARSGYAAMGGISQDMAHADRCAKAKQIQEDYALHPMAYISYCAASAGRPFKVISA